MPSPTTSIGFSVVIPTYNRAHLVGRALESVLDQEHAPAEVMVVDDGSTDETHQIVGKFGDRVCYLHQSNAGCSAARNAGVRQAEHDWVAFLDSDDAWAPNHLQTLSAAIRDTDGRASFYFTNGTFDQTRDLDLWQLSGFDIAGRQQLVVDGSDWVMLPRQPMMLQCSAFARATYLAAGGLLEDLRTREDTHLFLKVGIGRPVCAVKNAGVTLHEDDLAENRLTLAFPPWSRVYLQATIRLYADVLSTCLIENSEHRQELRRRLAQAHLQMARLSLREGRVLESGGHVYKVMSTAPGILGPKVGRRLRRLLP